MLEAIFGFGTFVVKTVSVALKAAATYVVNLVAKDFAAKFEAVATSSTIQIKTVKDIDAEVIDLKRKQLRDGWLSNRDQDKLLDLEAQRQATHTESRRAKEQELTRDAASQAETYVQSALVNGKVNLLQYHMGQSVLAKHCPTCGFPMVLQHQTIDNPQFDNFFWQCSRFYRNDGTPKCRNLHFRPSDVKLLHKDGIPELQATSDDLAIIGAQPVVQKAVQKRVREHIGDEDVDVLCPVHYVPMVLHEKKAHNGAVLDMYHLRCPHLDYDWTNRCGQTVKLKSVAQLAAYLRRMEGHGILD